MEIKEPEERDFNELRVRKGGIFSPEVFNVHNEKMIIRYIIMI